MGTGMWRSGDCWTFADALCGGSSKGSRQAGAGTADAPSIPRFASAVAFLPSTLSGAVADDGTQIVYRFLVTAMSNGDLSIIRVTERLDPKPSVDAQRASSIHPPRPD